VAGARRPPLSRGRRPALTDAAAPCRSACPAGTPVDSGAECERRWKEAVMSLILRIAAGLVLATWMVATGASAAGGLP